MKRFILNTFKLILTVFGILFMCDLVYTKIYETTTPRNKLQYILKAENEKFDIVFLGSSRVVNHIDVELFNSLSNKKAINLGASGAGLNDNLLQLKLLTRKNEVSKVFLQIDENYQRTSPTLMGTAEAMPFIRDQVIRDHAKAYFNNFNALYYVPFYRYAVNGPKIGFREMFFSLIGKKPRVDLSTGYIPKYGNNITQTGSLPGTILEKNDILEEIRNLCTEKNIELILFTSPYISAVKNRDYIEKLKQKVPDLIDLSSGYANDLFYNYNHLNDKGAKLFTKNLYNTILLDQNLTQ